MPEWVWAQAQAQQAQQWSQVHSLLQPTWLPGSGLATAATSVGWVLTSAVATGGTVLVLGKFLTDKTSVAEIVPHHINTPRDLLAQSLMGLLGGLAVRVATVEGEFHPAELRAIGDVLHGEWGYDRDYITKAVASLADPVSGRTTAELTENLEAFLDANPDCNCDAMKADLLEFVREIVVADGVIKPEEEKAIREIASALSHSSKMLFKTEEC